MVRKIAFSSGKGGVGKSTITANVAVAAAQLGEKVVLLDADVPMADLALSLGMDVEGPTLHEVLAGEFGIDDAIYLGPEGVKVVPAGISLDGVRKAKPQKLEKVLDELSERFGIIMIDAPPGLGVASLTVLRKCNELVLITIPVVNSLTDSLRTKRVTERYNTDPLGVIISRSFGDGSDVPDEEVEAMLDLPILGKVPEDPEVRRSASIGESVMTRSPDSPSAKAFRDLAEEIFINMSEIDYQELAEKTVSEIKEVAKKDSFNYKRMLKIEKENQNRKTLKSWLDSKIKSEY